MALAARASESERPVRDAVFERYHSGLDGIAEAGDSLRKKIQRERQDVDAFKNLGLDECTAVDALL